MPSETLKSRGFIEVSGEDRFDFLQGLITNDIEKFQTQPLLYSCLLTPQGKYLADFFVFEQGETIVIDCEKARLEATIKALNLFKLRSRVTISDESEKHTITAIWDETVSEEEGIWPDPRKPDMGYRCYNQEVSFSAGDYTTHRYQQGVPEGTKDIIVKRSTIQEVGLDDLNAVDWDKGCYMGQELTARIHYRGLIKKKLFLFRFEGDAPEPGTSLQDDNGKTIGEIRSMHETGFGFALLRMENHTANLIINLKEVKIIF